MNQLTRADSQHLKANFERGGGAEKYVKKSNKNNDRYFLNGLLAYLVPNVFFLFKKKVF